MAITRLSIDVDGFDRLGDLQSILEPRKFDRALKAGVRSAGTGIKADIARVVGKRYTWKAASIKRDIRTPRFSPAGDSVTVPLNRRPRTLAQFGGRLLSRGKYSYAIFRGQRQIERPAWIGRGANDALLPWVRTGPGRDDIQVLHGPSLGAVFLGSSRYGDVMRDEASEKVGERFAKGIDRYLDRVARGF